MTEHVTTTLEPWQWGAIVVLAAFVILTISEVTVILWALRRHELDPPPYDWQADDGWLDVLARDDEGEVLSIIPASWRYR